MPEQGSSTGDPSAQATQVAAPAPLLLACSALPALPEEPLRLPEEDTWWVERQVWVRAVWWDRDASSRELLSSGDSAPGPGPAPPPADTDATAGTAATPATDPPRRLPLEPPAEVG